MADTPGIALDRPLPVASNKRNSTAWYGVLCLIATEAALFVYLLFSYAYFAAQHSPAWLPTTRPALGYGLVGTALLLSSSATVWWGERGIRRGNRKQLLLGLGATILLGAAFVVVELLDWHDKTFSLSSRAYGSFYFTITGFHLMHVAVGVLVLLAVLGWSGAGAGYFTEKRHLHVTIGGLYWHFVDVVWVFVFSTFFLAPYLLP